MKGLASDAWNWGSDIISGIIDGIRSMIGNLADCVTGVADTIREFLHFSVPDKGPLTDYESWMPDFMQGLADGIIKSKKVIAKAVSGKTESYMGDRTCGELVEEFYPLIVDDILQNRQVNRDSLRPWLEDLKKIADNCGILPSRKEGRAANIWDLGSDVKLVLQETDGFNQAMTPYAVAELLNANVVSVENAFYPKMVIGINSRSEHVEIAKDFLRFALSEELQSVDTYEGFPVNAKALETQAAADRSMAEAYTTYDIDGTSAEFVIKSYSEETAKQLMELCKAATLCLKEDTQIETSLTESLQAYLNGQASVEEAMDAVEGSLKMYLAE